MKRIMLKPWKFLVVGASLLGAACASGPQRPLAIEGRKLPVEMLPTKASDIHIVAAGAQQLRGDVVVRVRLKRQRVYGVDGNRLVRVAVLNAEGRVQHSASKPVSRPGSARRGGRDRWVTLSVPHTLAGGEKLLLSVAALPPA